MKKLLTIALALVMVLALAAPAMATVGFGPQTEAEPATKTEWSVKIRALEFIPATNGFTFENNYYPDYDATKGIVAGSDLRFVVDVTFPKIGDIEDYDMFENIFDGLVLTVSGNNLAFGWWNGKTVTPLNITNTASYGHELNGSLPRVTTNSPTKAVQYLTLANYVAGEYPWSCNPKGLNSISYAFGDQLDMYGLTKSYTTTYSFMFVADVLNTADVTVSANVAATGRGFSDDDNDGIYDYTFTYGGKIYNVEYDSNDGYFDIWNAKDWEKVVRFTVDSKSQITNVAVTADRSDAFQYTTVKPLTNSEIAMAQALVAIQMGTTYAENLDKANAIKYVAAMKTLISSRIAGATLSDVNASWTNDVFAVKNNGAAWKAGDNVSDLTAKITATNLTEAAALLTPAGKLLVTYTPAATATEVTEAEAWKALSKTTGYENLVIGLPVDQYASSITGVPSSSATTTDCVPFLGWLNTAKTMSHCEWWNVNKDVKLAEIVFNLNDAVHTGGYKENTAAQTAYVKTFATPGSVTTENHFTYNKTVYAWADVAKSGLKIYTEQTNLYDAKNVTASKDVNQVQYNKLYPIFKEIMGVLDFQWDGTTAYMYRAAFVEKFGGKLDTTASYTYAAYTSALVVADPNAQPPQTGDTTSILGFVMIAVAVLAAGAVVVKKVRA